MRDSFFLPLIGGGRSQNIEILSVTPPEGFGTADIIGDLFRFQAGPELEALPPGVPIPFPVISTYIDGDGNTVESSTLVTAQNGPEGVQLTLPGGLEVTDTALLSPIPVGQQFDTPFTFETPPLLAPIVADESIFVDIFNARNPEFLENFSATQIAFTEATIARAGAVEATDAAATALEFLSDTADARALATVQRTVADTQAKILADLTAEFSDALVDLNAALAAQVSAQQALEAADAQVSIVSAQLELFQTVVVPNAAIAILEAEAAIAIQLSAFGLPAPIELHFDDPVVGPLFKGLAQNRDEKLQALQDAQDQVADFEGLLSDAISEQSEAINSFALATAALAQAQERIEDLSDVDFEQLEENVAALEAQAVTSELIADQLELVASTEFGVAVPVSEATLGDFSLAFNTAIQNQVLADVAAVEAQAAFEAAAEAYAAQLDALPDFEFDLAIFAARFGFEANLGLEFNFNRATDESPAEFVTTLLYEIALGVDVAGVLEVPVPTIFLPDLETPIDIDFELARSGRIEFGGGERAERPERGERFERADAEERFADFGSGERLGNWADSFDFL